MVVCFQRDTEDRECVVVLESVGEGPESTLQGREIYVSGSKAGWAEKSKPFKTKAPHWQVYSCCPCSVHVKTVILVKCYGYSF